MQVKSALPVNAPRRGRHCYNVPRVTTVPGLPYVLLAAILDSNGYDSELKIISEIILYLTTNI